MDGHTTSDDLATLRARLRAQEATTAALCTRLAAAERRGRARPRRGKFVAVAFLAAVLALLPVVAGADFAFLDLNPNSPHNANIAAIKDAGITNGCEPGIRYCPNDNVTREEMASFLARTAGLGGNPPIANAKTAQTATNAANAAQLGGQPASYYQPAAQPIANAVNSQQAQNASTVGGLAPAALLRAGRTIVPNQFATSTPTTISSVFPAYQTIGTVTIVAPANGFVIVTAQGIGFLGSGQVIYLRLTKTGTTESSPYSQIAGASLGIGTSVTYLFPTVAGTQTFDLEASHQPHAGFDSPQFANSTMVALYVPFGYNGGTTLVP